MIDIKTATHQELINEYHHQTTNVWGRHSSDSLGFYISALHKAIVALGGWVLEPTNKK